jgi:outer membrane scaffolding protein for murein synthesis (MipA/OmpV family)
MLKILLITLVIFIYQLEAKNNSELKLGAGFSFISVPEYIGSSSQKQYIVPYPYIYYKNNDITFEKNILFGHIYRKNDFSIDLSMSGTLPVKSDYSSLRYGMAQLDPTLEIGSNFIYKLFNFTNTHNYISIKLPIRTVFSLKLLNTHQQGYITNPNLYFQYYINQFIKLELSTGATYGTKKYHNYFYEVNSEDTTINRIEYHTKSGFGGWKTTAGLSYEKDNIWYGTFIRYYDLQNTIFLNSPLVDTNHSLFYGIALSYIF